MSETKVVDANDKPIEVGSRVLIGTEIVWVVTQITDPDGDVDDEGRTIGIPPYVHVEWRDSLGTAQEKDQLRTYWTAQGWWDEGAPYKCDDLEVVDGPES